MLNFSTPKWVRHFNYPYQKLEEVPDSLFEEINRNLDRIFSKEPLVSIIIPVWNEETSLLKSVASLASMNTRLPYEIIVVNNNSVDNTQVCLERLHLRSFFEPQKGTGPARQKGQENALGKYILIGDADTIYPPKWIDRMTEALQKPGMAVVYGRYAFIAEPGFPRWQLSILETLKNFIAEIRAIKRPFLNAYGVSMGYIREYGLKVGFVKSGFWGEDGVLTYDLMKFGKVKQVKAASAIVWTGTRALKRDGTLIQALKKRLTKEIKRITEYFHTRMETHAPRE